MRNVSTAVLIHGCHLQANLNGKTWDDIVMGPNSDGTPTLAGRAVMGVHVARQFDARLVIFSTGASEKDGFKEGEYTYRKVVDSSFLDAEDRRWLRQRTELDLESQNTADECRRNFPLAMNSGCDRIVLVSSPWHIQRCHTEALKAAENMRTQGFGSRVPEIIAIASHGPTEGVIVVEPPHRGDMPQVPFHKTLAPIFRFMAKSDKAFALDAALGTVIGEHLKTL